MTILQDAAYDSSAEPFCSYPSLPASVSVVRFDAAAGELPALGEFANVVDNFSKDVGAPVSAKLLALKPERCVGRRSAGGERGERASERAEVVAARAWARERRDGAAARAPRGAAARAQRRCRFVALPPVRCAA